MEVFRRVREDLKFENKSTKIRGAEHLYARSTIDLIKPNFPFKWAQDGITYFGTKIPGDLTKIFSFNFLPLLTSLKAELRRWTKGNLSWI